MSFYSSGDEVLLIEIRDRIEIDDHRPGKPVCPVGPGPPGPPGKPVAPVLP